MHPSLRVIVTALLGLVGNLYADDAGPPLAPPGWKVETVASGSALQHPSVVCVAPDGRVFVAQDPIDMDLPSDSAGDSILCLYPDGQIKTFATGLHAVFGLCYLDGQLYVHHAPFFSVFRDQDGVGKDRRDLFQTNPNPSSNGTDINGHIPANFRLAMDGWFYLSSGDRGIYGTVGPDGTKIELHGGGIIRFRPDGSHLEVYTTGTRNHLDIAMNAEDEMFTYDNTDDGQGWWTRVTHMVDGGYYGYPFEYKPRRPFTLWMMTDYGGGAPTGALAYNEDALPPEYRGNLFLCDWGRRQVLRLAVSRSGATYVVDQRIQTNGRDFLAKGSSAFNPVGIAVAADGLSFYVCDWNVNGWRIKEAGGRLLKVTYTGPSQATTKPAWWVAAAMAQPFSATTEELVTALRHPAQSVRMVAQRRLVDRGHAAIAPLQALLSDPAAPAMARWHAIWTIDAIGAGQDAIIDAASHESVTSVRAQAIRQLGSRQIAAAVPTLTAALSDASPIIRFQAATALGRIADPRTVALLSVRLSEKDLFARYSAFTALRRIGFAHPDAWVEIDRGLRSDDTAIREGTTFAAREVFSLENVQALTEVATSEDLALNIRLSALTLMTDLHRKPPPWDGHWWGTHPVLASPPAKTVAWEGTSLVHATLRRLLVASELSLRRAAVRGIAVVNDRETATDLLAMFEKESDAGIKLDLVETLGVLRSPGTGHLMAEILSDRSLSLQLRSAAIPAAGKIADQAAVKALMRFVENETESDLLVKGIDALGETKAATAVDAVARHLQSSVPAVRAAAETALGSIGGPLAYSAVRPLLDNSRVELRAAAIVTMGLLKNRDAIPKLLELADDVSTRNEVTLALARMPDLRALSVYLAGAGLADSKVRNQCMEALNAIRGPALPLIETQHRTAPITGRALSTLQFVYRHDDAARAGPLFAGQSKPTALDDYSSFALSHPGDSAKGRTIFAGIGTCIACHRVRGTGGQIGPDLSDVATKQERGKLIESVLYPSKQILDGYRTNAITLKNGETVAGFLRGENGEEATIVDAGGGQHVVKKNLIAQRTELNVSVMPDGLQATMSLENFADLIAYLSTLKGEPIAP